MTFVRLTMASYQNRPSSPRTIEENRDMWISNESVRGWLLGDVNVKASAKGAPKDGQHTAKTLRMIIWYKRACIGQTRDQFLWNQKKCRCRTSSNLENSVLELNYIIDVIIALNRTAAPGLSAWIWPNMILQRLLGHINSSSCFITIKD